MELKVEKCGKESTGTLCPEKCLKKVTLMRECGTYLYFGGSKSCNFMLMLNKCTWLFSVLWFLVNSLTHSGIFVITTGENKKRNQDY